MRKLPIIAFAAAAAFSMNAFAVTVDTANAVDVEASVDVAAPSLVSATWIKGPTLSVGAQPRGTKIGSMNVTNVGSSDGWVIYSNGSAASLSAGSTKYTFTNADGSTITARINDDEYPGIIYGAGTDAGTGPNTLIPAQYNTVDFKLNTAQNVNAGTYSATLSVATYNN
ncbi:CD15/CS22/SEF14 family fimbrial major subunit [Escherichia coli]|uniref:CD15/CS22/SEF14 family fimbrial major subunit n=1 Tax=Escherichia coli TaxID=562 RepID=UPI001CDCB896|nr:CD15/CS22/SEF14 family fimbrial major subunit [Escherichia coli]MED8075256.1 CD15/CS22/SEF14 family fimbrial major subunit [Escherichia coli]MED8080056.1 CD15/CS22/SEF14 family fimbrial major subunit [Escherichia coli]MED8118680.1 CD15/CS22/SEF14 family fimbrial major subunit [Escherichia coli]MED8123535.1 CD15/CS22/SEF14 family fimbrial major subunit [Escherichia coli]MED8128484.1 CD15/CS22/SEF14 family fimbrial major subunit [Escherichia coli]